MIRHAWKHRKHATSLRSFLLNWLKRIHQGPAFLSLEWNRTRMRLKGAKIDPTSICSPVSLHGSDLTVGRFCSIGRAYIQAFGHVDIKNLVVINDGVRIITGTHDHNSVDYRQIVRPVEIGDYAWVAMNATILPGVTIGKGAVVGAGSVVTRNVSAYTIVGGNPARVIGHREKLEFEYRPSYWFGPVSAWVG